MEGCLKRGFGQFADLRVVEGGEGGGLIPQCTLWLLMISINDSYLGNMVEVIKFFVETVRKCDCMNHCKNKSRKKHISNMKRDIIVQAIADLSIV